MLLANAGGIRTILYDFGGIHPVDVGEVAIYTLKASTVVGSYSLGITNLLSSNSSGMGSVPVVAMSGQVEVKTSLTMPSIPSGLIAQSLR